uniref:YsnF/AvaK domain-containing protein n=1 Tax=Pantoea sp. IMH TaxID=1267600 RepID=UPI00046AF57A|nr:YsnF/AvaK domain-containing protein [Pantoea sp. IMH]
MGNKNAPQAEQAERAEIMPLAEEEVTLSKQREVDSRLRLERTTHSVDKLLEAELTRDEVHIEHVAKNQLLTSDDSPQVRQEGEVLIIPVIEEQVEIIRRKVLKEEIHIHKRTKTELFRESVTLRNQEVTITKEKP